MQALFDLAHHSHGQPVPLHVIAERQALSLPFLEQIFNKLKKAGVVATGQISRSKRSKNAAHCLRSLLRTSSRKSE